MDIIKKFEPLFGEWYAESFIGAGSFGRVYRIYREELGHRFYSALKYISIPASEAEVKQLRADGMDDNSISTYYGTMAKDISSETTLMDKLRGNTNIVSFEDSRVVPKPSGIGYDIFIRMELLDSLTNRMVEHPLTNADVAKLGYDLSGALTLCAKSGIIHRDIKPDNIFISPNGDYKLGDFGIARQLEKTTGFMSKKGTYNYMAPEVYKGEKYGAACDIYSLGLVMYRLLNNGRLPFLPPVPQVITPDDRENGVIRRMKGETIPPPCSADEALAEIVLKACAFDPADRWASAEELRAALLRYRMGLPGSPVSVNKKDITGPSDAPRPAPVQPEPPKRFAAQTRKREPSMGLESVIPYFWQKADKYAEYDMMKKSLPAKIKKLTVLLVLGIILASIGSLLLGAGVDVAMTEDDSEAATGLFVTGSVLFTGGAGMIAAYIITSIARRKNFVKAYKAFDAVGEELYRHYLNFGPCPVKPEFSNPHVLRAIASAMSSGMADNIPAAINILSARAAAADPGVFTRHNEFLARNSSRKGAAPVVFLPGDVFGTR